MASVGQSVLLCGAACVVSAELSTSHSTTSSLLRMAQPKDIPTSLIYLSLLLDCGARPSLLSRRVVHALFDRKFLSVSEDECPTWFEQYRRLLLESDGG